ncbi:uncharacterized protein N7473_007785 [Penicillium subrubescens]|uniref:uncharacterized protein n=1 Tax=Penicillium subrubescens TaxID=1316194 RepID=UPI0025457FBE|nr:uncharacterized protein N7473_007785 [Penicillium subrubescens]KAJ5891557.1 hypothetical protein N7473_007785 [Penicillium subrubescens]
MSSPAAYEGPEPHNKDNVVEQFQHVENTKEEIEENLVYEEDEEPELHAQTYFALAAMLLLNLVQVFGLLGPPTVLSYIEKDLKNTATGTWVPNSLSLVQAVLAPVIASLSDTFQARKAFLVGPAIISFIGCAIAPGSTNIYRLIAAQVLIGFGFATVPLAYCVPSDILPRKWRPSEFNFFCCGFKWPSGAWQRSKLGRVDLPGFSLLTAGLAIFLTGLNLGGSLYTWSSAPVLATLIIGIITLFAFGIYEWKFTKTGILHHDLFHGGRNGDSARHTFAICIGLIFIEGILLFAFIIFYPVLTETLFETDPFLGAARQLPYWIASAISTVIYGYCSTKFQTIRSPMVAGAMAFVALAGLGFGSPLILAIAGVQLSVPHHLIATATAATTCSRAIATAVFTAIFSAAFSARLEKYIPEYVSKAAVRAGLPKSSIKAFVKAVSSEDNAALKGISGVTLEIIDSGISSLKQAYADGLRVVFIIAVPFGVLACIASLFLGDLKKAMNYGVDAPMENLHAKRRSQS